MPRSWLDRFRQSTSTSREAQSAQGQPLGDQGDAQALKDALSPTPGIAIPDEHTPMCRQCGTWLTLENTGLADRDVDIFHDPMPRTCLACSEGEAMQAEGRG